MATQYAMQRKVLALSTNVKPKVVKIVEPMTTVRP